VTLASARTVTQSVTSAVSQGVVQALFQRSPAATHDCALCDKAGTNCHACEAGRAWAAESGKEAARLAAWYGQYYGEYWARVFLAEDVPGVLQR
jgi:hypothetical protein